MGYAEVIILLVLVTGVVTYSIDQYGNRRTFPWYVQITAFLAWVFPFAIVFILPLDITSTWFEQCKSMNTTTVICDEPLGYVSTSFLWTFWRSLYWTMFCLTWFTIPIMQSWLRSGEFSSPRRFWDAIKQNLIYYASVGALGIVLVIYAVIIGMFTSAQQLLDFAMAGANAWGLLLCIIALGFGLVDIPKKLWREGSTLKSLRTMEADVLPFREAMVEAESHVYEVARDIHFSSKKIHEDDPLRPLMERIIRKCPSALDGRGFNEDETPATISRSYLLGLHARVKRAFKIYDRNKSRYEFLLLKIFLLQDILEHEKSVEKRLPSKFLFLKEDKWKSWKETYYWYYYVWIRPYTMRCLSVICGVVSIALVWSETVFNVDKPVLSIPALIFASPAIGNMATEIICFMFTIYMCACAYSALFKVKFLDYKLVPHHHSDEGSVLFVGAYLCRLTFPLCYNFLRLVKDEDNSIFVKFLGRSVNLAPLLGERYNDWLPLMILVFSIIFLLKLHRILLRIVGLSGYFDISVASERVLDEARELIQQVRSIEERKLARGEWGSTYNLGEIPKLSSKPTAAGSLNTADFLAKYKRDADTRVVVEKSTRIPAQDDDTRISSEDDESRALLFARPTKKTTKSNNQNRTENVTGKPSSSKPQPYQQLPEPQLNPQTATTSTDSKSKKSRNVFGNM